mgnify:CR=1 FL=1
MTRTAADIIADLGTGVHIDGRWRDAASGATFEVHNPATGEVVATVADGGPDDAAAAIEAAGRTQASWGAVPARERAEILRRAYELLIERADELALIMKGDTAEYLQEERDLLLDKIAAATADLPGRLVIGRGSACWQEEGRRAYEFVRRNWGARSCAERLLEAVYDPQACNLWVDPSSCRYVWGCGMHALETVENG